MNQIKCKSHYLDFIAYNFYKNAITGLWCKVSQSVQSLSHVQHYVTLWTVFPVRHQLPEPTETHVHWVGDAIQPSHPLSSTSPAFNLFQHQGLFQGISSLHQVARVLEFQFQHQSFQLIFKLISVRLDWLDLLAVQETLKSLLQHHSSKASIL